MRQNRDRHGFIFGALFFATISIPLSLGNRSSVLAVPNVGQTVTIANNANPPVAEIMAVHQTISFEPVDEIINFKTSLGLDQKAKAVGTGVTIIGVASTYNPYRPGRQEGGKQTASGERYDPIEWTAAIQTDFREKFGGVSYGKQYRAAYALVEGADKKAIIRINDVGPLKPGRVIDFNEQTMRYFDPTLKLGLIRGIMVTPLVGDDWPTGPIE
jgi:rare lipoprotein A